MLAAQFVNLMPTVTVIHSHRHTLCHSLPPRWLEGEHPQEEGETVEVVAFFDFDNNPKYKSVPVSFKMSLESGPRLQATEVHGRIYVHQKSSVICVCDC